MWPPELTCCTVCAAALARGHLRSCLCLPQRHVFTLRDAWFAAELELGFHRRSRQRLIKPWQAGGWIGAGIRVLFFSKKKSVFLYLSTQKSLLTSLLGHLPLKDTLSGISLPCLTLKDINPLSKRHSWNPRGYSQSILLHPFCFQAPYSANALVTSFWFKSIKSKSALFFQMKGDLWGNNQG